MNATFAGENLTDTLVELVGASGAMSADEARDAIEQAFMSRELNAAVGDELAYPVRTVNLGIAFAIQSGRVSRMIASKVGEGSLDAYCDMVACLTLCMEDFTMERKHDEREPGTDPAPRATGRILTMNPKYPEVEVQLSGEDRNAMAIMARVSRAMERAGLRAEANAFRQQAMSGSYDDLLQLCMRTVRVN